MPQTSAIIAKTTRRRSDAQSTSDAVQRAASRPGRSRNIPGPRIRVERPFGVAQSYRLLMSYTGTNNWNLSTTYQEATIVINDPTSAQGFAKMSAFYSKALVTAARVNLHYAAVGVTQPWVVGLAITTNATSLGSVARAVNDGFGAYRVHTSHPDSGSLSVGVDVAKFANVPDLRANYPWFALSGVAPAQLVVAHIWYQTLNGAAGGDLLSGVFDVEFEVIFTDPIPFT